MTEHKIFENSANSYLSELINKFETDLKPFSQETVLNKERLCELIGKSRTMNAVLQLLRHRMDMSENNKNRIDNLLRLIEMYDDYVPDEIREEDIAINLQYELSTQGEK